jgi:hypothetical protein
MVPCNRITGSLEGCNPAARDGSVLGISNTGGHVAASASGFPVVVGYIREADR